MNASMSDKEYLKSLTVLYVEDDEDAREQFTLFLGRIVGKLVVARDGAEGLEAFHTHHPSVIITDILMPNMDGLTMAGEIRASDRKTQIILLTAFEEIDYLKRSINVGVNRYITKPVNGFHLHETLLECAHSLLAEEALQCAARTDHLTGIANRWEIMRRFDAEKGRAERHGTPLSIIIADIDHFKSINDRFGHIAGDRALRSVAKAIRSSIRVEDACGRWGGEEFLLLLPDTDLANAAVVAEKLRYAVSGLAIQWEGEPIAVTMSMGVGQFSPGMTLDECLRGADLALYRAKEGGRNRVELAAP
jgi:two-component system chemotaxis response regulator CheY